MKRRDFLIGAAAVTVAALVIPMKAFSFPTVFPHGTTIYKPEKCWSGYTVFGTEVESEGTVLIDMNGNVVKQWKNICQAEHPPKMLKGGFLAGTLRPEPDKRGRVWGDEHSTDLVVVDWDGKVVRRVPRAGMHHDYQFEGNPVGYHAPGMVVDNYKGKMLILSHKFTHNQYITDKELYDDYIVEIDRDGNIVWEWTASEHFKEMNFPLEFKKTLYKYPTYSMTRTPGRKGADWIHVNSASYLGPNKWYDEDPETYKVFHPDNIIISNRQTNTSCIIEKATGKIVWQIGPYYYPDSVWEFGGKQYKYAYRKLGQIIGQHHTHMIPKGLPGEGNILVYDNGGYAGYGPRNPGAHLGWSDARRDYSRVIEFDPRTLKVVWEHSAKKMGMRNKYQFYSDYVSSAQRLPNGNTLITNGAVGQLQEVTPDHEIVWEYISPYYNKNGKYNLVYRAYRIPYDYVPQIPKPEEKAVIPPENTTFTIQPS
ncbi:MAG: aryl-sulfate sulfotransferase [Deltaproteobacteria bacterium]|nr:aryl-sulfate sulfotransferase [Deltaproteobacteria bacterium]MBW2355282.1 aryl-sulfate sulfotransferase [Deltaproteobacteria bacterium]RLB99011.1 MAG: transcriptional initiation protein Tat [Deltaproteobacteria bacterium]